MVPPGAPPRYERPPRGDRHSREALTAWGLRQVLNITPEPTYRVLALPRIHNDPFFCLLTAQALCEGMTFLSPDPAFRLPGAPH